MRNSLFILLLAFLFGFSPFSHGNDKPLIVGSEQDYPPFALGLTDAEADGFTVELWRAVAAESHLSSTIRVLPFHDVLKEFKAGKIDVLINLAQSDERRQFSDFTVPHVIVNGAIFVRNSENRINSEADLNDKSIIVLNGDLAHDYALSKGWKKQLILVDTADKGFRLLAAGQSDALLLSKLAGKQTLEKLKIKNIKMLPVKVGFAQKFSFAVHKGNAELLAKINEGLALTKANGIYDRLYEKWFGIYEEKALLPLLIKYLTPIVAVFLLSLGIIFYRRSVEGRRMEQELRDNQAFITSILDSLTAHIAVVDPNGIIIAVNHGWKQFAEENNLPKDCDYMVGRSYFEQCQKAFDDWHLEEAVTVQYGIMAVLAGTRVFFEMEYPCHSATEQRWFYMRVTPLKNTQQGVVISHENITQRKLTEQAVLRESEKNLALLHNASDGIHILDTEGNIIEISDSFCAMLGYQRDEMIGMNVTEWDVNFAPDECRRLVKQQFANPQRSVFETRHRCKDGSVIQVEVSGFRVELEGRLVLFNSSRDISRRKQAEQYEQFRNHILILLAGDNELRYILEEIVQGVEHFNPAMLCSVLLLDREGKHLIDGVAPSLPDFYNAAVNGIEIGIGVGSCGTAAFTGEHVIVEDISSHPYWTPYKQLAAKARLGSCWSQPILSSSHQVLGTFAIYHHQPHTPEKSDIDFIEQLARLTSIAIERKQAEAELRRTKEMAIAASHAKSEFLANMSHEIRTPMNAILGFSEILNNLITDATQRYYLDAIHRSGKTLLQLINDILDLSKIEAGKFTLQYSPVSLRTLLDDVSIIFSQKAADKNLAFSVLIDENLPDTLLLDEIRVRQVLLNLLGNAFKFTEKGFVTIKVAVSFSVPDKEVNLQIDVCDSGTGIPKEQQEKIFAAFTQQDNQSLEYGGTGLGLTICRRLMELMHGHISVESEVGKGSCFTLTLNAIEIGHSQSKIVSQSLPALNFASVKFQPARILLVDDIRLNRQLICSYLAEFTELVLSEAETAAQTLTLITQQPFELILMDRRLPDMDGDELCKKIKSLPGYAAVPIIMISASVLSVQESQQTVFYDLQLSKPLNKTELLNAMQLFLADQASQKVTAEPENTFATETASENITSSESLPELLALLASNYQMTIAQLKNSGVLQIDTLINLAEQLRLLAEQYHCDVLFHWANTLKTQAELFDLEKLPKTLCQFDGLLKQLAEKI